MAPSVWDWRGKGLLAKVWMVLGNVILGKIWGRMVSSRKPISPGGLPR